MKISVNHFPYKKLLLFSSLLFTTSIFADTANSDYEFNEEESWSTDTSVNSDPFESFNRPVYHFNDFIYLRILDPITNVYVNYTPKIVRNSFKNFFTNLRYPVRFVSNVLQIKFKESYYETLKFGLNSTVGIFGINAPSDNLSFLNCIPDEDLGQVLATWGIPEGPYIVVPILGPSTLRDLPARVVEREINFIDVSSDNWKTVDSEWTTLLNTAEILSIYEEMLPRYKSVQKTSIDPYLAVRSAYFQQRAQAVGE